MDGFEGGGGVFFGKGGAEGSFLGQNPVFGHFWSFWSVLADFGQFWSFFDKNPTFGPVLVNFGPFAR